MTTIPDIKLELPESVNYSIANKIINVVLTYTQSQIKIYKVTSSDSNDTYYRYDLYIDGKNKYMKKKPNKQEIKNIQFFVSGIIYTMHSFE